MTVIYAEDRTAGDAAAEEQGFTRRVHIDGGMQDGEFLIREDTDLESKFKAWAVDWQEWTWVFGWNVTIEELSA